MRHFVLIFFFALTTFYCKSQSMRIYVAESVKGVEIPVERRKFEITLNDTIKLNLTTASNGLLGKVDIEVGTYKILIQNPEYKNAIVENVIVEESKNTNLTIIVAPKIAIKEEEKPRIEK